MLMKIVNILEMVSFQEYLKMFLDILNYTKYNWNQSWSYVWKSGKETERNPSQLNVQEE